jgi:hypothetical protein
MSSMTLHLKVHEGNEGLLRAGQAMLNGAAENSRMPRDTRLRVRAYPQAEALPHAAVWTQLLTSNLA